MESSPLMELLFLATLVIVSSQVQRIFVLSLKLVHQAQDLESTLMAIALILV